MLRKLGLVHVVASIAWLVVTLFTGLLGIALVMGLVVDDKVNEEALGLSLIVIAIMALVALGIIVRGLSKKAQK